MNWETYGAFVAASALVLLSPGPTVLLVTSYALSQGRGSAWYSAAGVGLGDLTALGFSLAGLGALLSASTAAFTLLKWLGAAYLIYLGVRMWRRGDALGSADGPRGLSGWAMLRRAYVVTALNPKSIVFFVAFLPQFVVQERGVITQFILLGVTFVTLAVGNAVLYANAAGCLARFLQQPGTERTLGRIGGSVLIGAGMLAILWRQT
ncbi:MAG: LysE family translocator [Desulfarculaceae bacterium]|nr:LysE family translocator [Desulfarculaceae bacterium]MCF8047832.1 LysE family translocator [Desulfarculaceae bacterium]MCF8066673.1 LysE family translocator [Desulfarculaceae bacterium]MCF8096864.1 LysE family translocator [Desulfarculaceae bacterium]MCF8121691.1 LysE family translocator [Desulfarculaceae bacterium]